MFNLFNVTTKKNPQQKAGYLSLEQLNKDYEVHNLNLKIMITNILDNSRLSLAKAISDAETLARKIELSRLKEEVRELELYDPAVEHEKELDDSA